MYYLFIVISKHIIGGSQNQEGGEERPPLERDAVRREALQKMAEKSRLEVINPNNPNARGKLGEFIRLMYQQDPAFGPAQENEVALAMITKIANGPLRLSMLRYSGPEINVGSGEIVLPNQVVAINSAKQTLVYPNEYFAGLIRAKETFSMDDLTTAVMSPQSDFPFKTYEQIEAMREGQIQLEKAQDSYF